MAMKKGKVTGIVGIEITCEPCKELCVGYTGSEIILPSDETVSCPYCDISYEITSNAFIIPNMKRKNADLSKNRAMLQQS